MFLNKKIMSKKKTEENLNKAKTGVSQEKPAPTFLQDDYPYKAVGEQITDMEFLKSSAVYEIKCHQCEMSIRSQGINIKSMFERLSDSGCIGCGNKHLVVKQVKMPVELMGIEIK